MSYEALPADLVYVSFARFRVHTAILVVDYLALEVVALHEVANTCRSLKDPRASTSRLQLLLVMPKINPLPSCRRP